MLDNLEVIRNYESLITSSPNKKATGELLLSMLNFRAEYVEKKFFYGIIRELNPELANEISVDTCIEYLSGQHLLQKMVETENNSLKPADMSEFDLIKLNFKRLNQVVRSYVGIVNTSLTVYQESLIRGVNRYFATLVGDYNYIYQDRHKIMNCTFLCLDYDQMTGVHGSKEMSKLYENIADYYMLIETEYKNAMEYYKRALKIYRTHKEEYLEVMNVLIKIAGCYKSLGQIARALEYYNQAHDLGKEYLFPKDPCNSSLVLIKNQIVSCCRDLGYYERALECSKNGMDNTTKFYDKLAIQDHPNIAQAITLVAECYEESGDYKSAFEYRLNALDMCKRIYVNKHGVAIHHPSVAKALASIANCDFKKGEYEKALDYYRIALDKYKKVYKCDNHIDVASQLSNVAMCYEYLGEHAKAMEFYEQATSMVSNLANEKMYLSKADILDKTSRFYDRLSESELALEFKMQALNMYKRALQYEFKRENSLAYKKLWEVKVRPLVSDMIALNDKLGHTDEATKLKNELTAINEKNEIQSSSVVCVIS